MATTNWANRVEDLLDDGDIGGAVKLLEELVEKLQIDGGSNQLTLAGAMRDLAGLYDRQGLSLKADSLRSSAITIRSRAEWAPASTRSDERAPVEEASSGEHNDGDNDDVEDWEQSDVSLPVSLSKPSSEKAEDDEPVAVASGNACKQRGRGAFTFGSSGLYSDKVSRKGALSSDEELEEESDKASVVYGARHVLVIDSFPPKTTTLDLEQLVKPYSTRGVVIRWINDTSALAVFRNPTIAREALASIRHPPYRLQTLEASSEVHGSVSERDLIPPAPRPATSARAAQRMIVSALQSQGAVRHNVQTKARFTADELRQENDRKHRLLTREKLREEAWGD